MFRLSVSTAVVIGTLFMASIPSIGLARDHGGASGVGHGYSGRSVSPGGGRSFSGRSYGSTPGVSRYSGRQNFVSPRGYEGRQGYATAPGYYGRGYIAPRSYVRPYYRGYYGGGVYLGFGVPYGYAYDPYYYNDPGYAGGPVYSYGPAPAPQACTTGSYDQYGNWQPDPNCSVGQQQYQQAPPNYDPQQYGTPQQNYGPNSGQYPPAQQNYGPPPQYNR